jgi:hypothetical protein
MINKQLKMRLKKDRPSMTITMRVPADIVDSLRAVAPLRGFTAYQTLLKSNISEGLRRERSSVQYHDINSLNSLKPRKVAQSGSCLIHSLRHPERTTFFRHLRASAVRPKIA